MKSLSQGLESWPLALGWEQVMRVMGLWIHPRGGTYPKEPTAKFPSTDRCMIETLRCLPLSGTFLA